jgi:hypothetical protein
MSDSQPALDPDIVDALALAQRADDSADAAALARVRSKLMKRIAADAAGEHLTVAADGGRWHPFLPGIERKVLHERDGLMSYLLKFAPGAVLPAHRHPVAMRNASCSKEPCASASSRSARAAFTWRAADCPMATSRPRKAP